MGDGPVLLSSGFSAPESFPGAALADLAGDLLRNRAAEALQYGPREGYIPLRNRIGEWLAAEGVTAGANEIVIVTGAKQGIDLAARAFCAPGDSVLVPEPTYMNGLKILGAAGARVVTVSNDEHGMDVEAVERTLAHGARTGNSLPKLIYDIPDFHNPTGTVMAAERREKLIGIATKYQIPILEDSPYRWLRYEGTHIPPLKTFDKTGIVISLGTFSKILSPGLRIGWVNARRDIIERLLQYKADSGTSPFAQMLAFEFFKEDGRLESHLDARKSLYRTKRDIMLASLETSLHGHATWTKPLGGYYVWVTLSKDQNADDFANEAKAEGVLYYRGSVFFARKDPPRNHMRLAFSFENADRIRSGVAALAKVITGRSMSSSSTPVVPARPA